MTIYLQRAKDNHALPFLSGLSVKSIMALIFTLFFLGINHEVLADTSNWLEKVAKAYGGEKQILAANSYQQSGVTFSKLRNREGKMTRSYRNPDHLRIDIDYGTVGSELRLLAGPHSWKQNKAVGEPFYSAMLLQATRLGLPVVLFEHKKNVKDAGDYKNKQGKILHLLELTFHKHNLIRVGIDPETGRIVESNGILRMNAFQMQFGTRYDDFRMVDGRLFAFKETHYVMGRKTGFTNLHRIVTEPLPDKLFYPENIKTGEGKTFAAFIK